MLESSWRFYDFSLLYDHLLADTPHWGLIGTLGTGGSLIWRPSRAWDVALGYKYFSRKIESDTFYNKVNYNIPFVSISRFW